MMRWRKLGVVWRPEGHAAWARTHAACPTPLLLNDEVLRLYVQCRDSEGIGRVGYLDVSASDPLQVLGVSPQPVLDIGEPGTFDDNGVLQTSIIQAGDGSLYMYYVGFELSLHIRYRLLTGLAVSRDGGETFDRVRRTPILERSSDELYFRGGPFVVREDARYRMWYVAGSAWTDINGKSMPVYDLRYIESADGVDWPSRGEVCMQLSLAQEHGFGRPYVLIEGGKHRMFYSIRKTALGRYRLGYAESDDGIRWTRRDDELGIDVSPSGWDSESIEYSAPVRVKGKTYLFYNGNDLGGTGVGVAVLEQE
jgi:predicted GH43/DUF377 family glycosyl hydrolase